MPIIIPISIAIEKFATVSPPNINKDIITNNVVKDVTSVLDSVWLIDLSSTMGLIAVLLASVNIFGGFMVAQRMLAMFKKKK